MSRIEISLDKTVFHHYNKRAYCPLSLLGKMVKNSIMIFCSDSGLIIFLFHDSFKGVRIFTNNHFIRSREFLKG